MRQQGNSEVSVAGAQADEPFTRALLIVGACLLAALSVGARGQLITLQFFRDQDAPVQVVPISGGPCEAIGKGRLSGLGDRIGG